MNYLAQGLDQGFALGANAREKKKDREERERLERARRELELDVLGKKVAADKELQNARLVSDAQRQFSQQGWQTGESEKDRGFRTGERIGSEGFTGMENQRQREFTGGENQRQRDFSGSQSQLDRDAANLRTQKQLDEAARQFNTKMPLEGAELGLRSRGLDIQAARNLMPPELGAEFNSGTFPPEAEGKIVMGPDGKRYKIVNGTPVPQ